MAQPTSSDLVLLKCKKDTNLSGALIEMQILNQQLSGLGTEMMPTRQVPMAAGGGGLYSTSWIVRMTHSTQNSDCISEVLSGSDDCYC